MGAIQGSINTLIGTAAAAATAVAKDKEQTLMKEEQGLLAKEQYHEAKADFGKLTAEQEELGNEIGKLKEGGEAKMTELKAAERAFSELSDRIEAKKAMMSRAEKIMKRTGTWGGMR